MAGDTYDPRMYAHGCKTSKVMAQIMVRAVGSKEILGEKYFSDWIGFGHILLKDLPAGTYEIFVQYAWPENSYRQRNELVKDYTVRVYAGEQVILLDNQGRTSITTGHDLDFWQDVLRAKQSQANGSYLQALLS